VFGTTIAIQIDKERLWNIFVRLLFSFSRRIMQICTDTEKSKMLASVTERVILFGHCIGFGMTGAF
jgi:hypothetical protein